MGARAWVHADGGTVRDAGSGEDAFTTTVREILELADLRSQWESA